jgi:hypothetical protein
VRKYGPWETARFCKHCREYLTRSEFFDGRGMCPHCGNRDAVLVDITERSRRKVFTTGRRAAIEASKAQTGFFPNLCYRVTMLRRRFGLAERNYTWEYKT